MFDLETSSNRPSDTEIVQVAALAINPRNLTPYADAEFESLMRPLRPDDVQPDALRVNKKTMGELMEAPHPAEVWERFATWCAKFNLNGRSDAFSNPIPAGHNILGFDLPIYRRYCEAYGTMRTKKNGEKEPTIFSNFWQYDTMQMLGQWHENGSDVTKFSMDYLRKRFKMPAGDREAHDALQDVRDTAAILVKLLRLYRLMSPKVVWKDCFDEEAVKAEVERRAAAKEKENERRRKVAFSGRGQDRGGGYPHGTS